MSPRAKRRNRPWLVVPCHCLISSLSTKLLRRQRRRRWYLSDGSVQAVRLFSSVTRSSWRRQYYRGEARNEASSSPCLSGCRARELIRTCSRCSTGCTRRFGSSPVMLSTADDSSMATACRADLWRTSVHMSLLTLQRVKSRGEGSAARVSVTLRRLPWRLFCT